LTFLNDQLTRESFSLDFYLSKVSHIKERRVITSTLENFQGLEH
jgi:hypothetical protein